MIVSIASGLFVVPVEAAINQQINYQGKLTDPVGSNVADGTYSIVFRLYTVASGGSHIWTETQSVSVTNGLFSVMLGSVSSLSSVDFNQPLYLGVNVGGDGEMSPRKVIGSVPTAFTSDKLDNLDSTDFLSTTTAAAPKLWSLTGLGEVGSSSATTTVLGRLSVVGTTIISGLLSAYQTITAPNFIATSTTASVFPYASSTAITISGTASTTNLIVSGNSSLGTITSGTWNGTTIGVGYGGTGLTSTPTYGQLLVGNGSGYTLSATSTLGIALSDTTGTLSGTRGGTGLSSITLNQLLIGGAGNTWTQVATSSLGLPTFSSLDSYLTLSGWYATTTDGLDEGLTNLYFTNNRFDTRLSGTTSLPNIWSLTGLGQIGSSSAVTTIAGTASTSALIVSGNVRFSSLINCDTIDTDASGNLVCGADAGAGGGISSLNGLTNSTQNFATSSDTNLTLTITSSGSTHTFTPGWTGTLAVSRGGTGTGSIPSYGQILVGNGSGYTLTATSSLGLLTTNVAEGSNQYFTDARARAAISETITGIGYDNSTGVFSLTSGFNIPLTASTTNWNNFYDTPSTRITAGTGLTWSGNILNCDTASGSAQGCLSAADWTTFNNKVSSQWTDATGGINYGSGNVGVGTANPQWNLNVVGAGQVLNGTAYTNTAFLQDQTNYRGVSLGYDTSGQIGVIAANSDGTASDLAFWGYTGGGWAESMRIKGNGNIGIGSTSPWAKLSVDGRVAFQGDNFATTTIGNRLSTLTIGNTHIPNFNISIPTLFGQSLDTDVGNVFGVGINSNLFVVENQLLNSNPSVTFAAYDLANTASFSFATTSNQFRFNAEGGYEFQDGNVLISNYLGVGTTSPWQELSVNGDFVLTGRLYDSLSSPGTNGQILQSTGTGLQWVATSSVGITASSLGITSSQWTDVTGGINYSGGNVGVGTTSPWARLSITNNSGDVTPSFIVEDSGSGDTTPFVIDGMGNVGVGTTTNLNYKMTIQGKLFISDDLVLTGNSNLALGTTTVPTLPGSFLIDSSLAGLNGSEFFRIDSLSGSGTGFTQTMKSTYVQASSTSQSNSALYGVLNVRQNAPQLGGILSSAIYGDLNTGVANTSHNLTAIRGTVSQNEVGAMTSRIVAGGYFTNYASASTTYGVHALVGGADSVSLANHYYGLSGLVTKSGNSAGTNYGVYGSAENGGINWAGYFDNGNVYIKNNLGIGSTSPAYKLSVDGEVRFQGTNFATTTIGDTDTYFQFSKGTFTGGFGTFNFPVIRGKAIGNPLTEDVVLASNAFGVVQDPSTGGDPAFFFVADDFADTGNVGVINYNTAGTFFGLNTGISIRSDTTPYISFGDGDDTVSSGIVYDAGNDSLSFQAATGGYSFDDKVFMSGLSTNLTGNAVCITAGNEITNAGAASCVPSSLRFKEHVEDLATSTTQAIIEALRVVTFDYKDGAYSLEDGKESIGLIAEEVEGVDRRLVDYDFKGKPLTLKFDRLIALTIQSVQELWRKVTNHEDRIKKLEEENAELKARVDALGGTSNIPASGGSSGSGSGAGGGSGSDTESSSTGGETTGGEDSQGSDSTPTEGAGESDGSTPPAGDEGENSSSGGSEDTTGSNSDDTGGESSGGETGVSE